MTSPVDDRPPHKGFPGKPERTPYRTVWHHSEGDYSVLPFRNDSVGGMVLWRGHLIATCTSIMAAEWFAMLANNHQNTRPNTLFESRGPA